ncbi:FAD-dependent oxidoreductase [Amycolatopsis sp.]|uniref:FAD-dependent oxidoreductase n=1 Tax=Amycolatopsis sp. TaxID=37632 RepID=UPI002CECEE23|nr:FAD-dependent oxidoreductase [Amycolatopsis sp.]HVV08179.1 FAD-dependent oxidoreductase [Amycolatopsis sp.]
MTREVTARSVDAVIIGGGVAGCAAAARLARAGFEVLVLERETAYRDQVRGEGLVNWGYREAADMGLGQAILGAEDASPITRLVNYDETWSAEAARERATDLSAALPGTPGIIGVGHAGLRESLATEAVTAGAAVLRGIHVDAITTGSAPSVTYTSAGHSHTVTARLVIAADGKNSATRRLLDIPMYVTRPRVMLSGLAVHDGGAWDRAETVIGVEGRTLFYVIPRGLGRVRLYVGRVIDDPERFTGSGREQRLLDCFRLKSLPNADVLADARPAGPCASFPMTDSWTEAPLLPGVALLGDAAGWSNPVTGQGLAVALRDARVLTDLLLEVTDWSVTRLSGYAAERATRMARLRFTSAITDLLTAFGAPDRAARRSRMGRMLAKAPELGAAFAAVHAGPWAVPAGGFSPDILTTLALA